MQVAIVRKRMVGVGGIAILDLLQNTNDLTAACVDSQHLDNSEQTRPEPKDSWIGTCLNFHFFDIQNWLP